MKPHFQYRHSPRTTIQMESTVMRATNIIGVATAWGKEHSTFSPYAWPLDTQPDEAHKLETSRRTGQVRLQRREVNILSLLHLRVSQPMRDIEYVYTRLQHILEWK